jgi:membrane-bound metal-dependent hydrolase YbcI (DUF457 family)
MNGRFNWDALGIATSLACAIHCAVLPLLLTSLPIFGINIINNISFEYFMIFLAFCIGVLALWNGYRQHHHSFWPLTLFSLGIIALFAKQGQSEWHTELLLVAVVLIVCSHLVNFRLLKKAKACADDRCAS